MTDPLNPAHDEPAEGPRDAGFTGQTSPETAKDTASDAAKDTAADASAKANEVFEQIRDVVEDFAEKAAPTVREFSAKAAELVAVACWPAGSQAVRTIAAVIANAAVAVAFISFPSRSSEPSSGAVHFGSIRSTAPSSSSVSTYSRPSVPCFTSRTRCRRSTSSDSRRSSSIFSLNSTRSR